VFLFFIAGHGKTIGGDYYFLPGAIAAFADEAIRRQGFGPQQWQEWFENIKAQKSIFIFDTCESGAAARIWQRGRGSDEGDAAYQRLKEATGRVIFMAASDQQACVEGFHGHSLLTYTILEGLALAGDGKSDKIDLTDLKNYVQLKVPQYSREMNACAVVAQQQHCQKPLVEIFSRDYPLVPRYPQILAKLKTDDPAISRKPTHVVLATTDLLDQAARGAGITRQLPQGTQVTLIKAEDGWAHVAQDGKPIGYVREDQLLPLIP
jgi:hypothetical protein